MKSYKIFLICLLVFNPVPATAAGTLFDCFGLFKRSGTPLAREYYNDAVRKVHGKMTSRNDRAKQLVKSLAGEKKPLKVVTLNTGLLNAKVLGFVDISVPLYAERSASYPAQLKKYIASAAPDVFFLQEVWHPSDIQAIRQAISPLGYEIVSSTQASEGWFPLGLHTIVKTGTGNKVIQSNTNRSSKTSLKEKVAGIHRGNLTTTIQTADGTKILLLNSHLTFAEGNTAHRLEQVRDMAAATESQKGEFDFLLMGADTNSSDVFDASENTPTSKWYVDKEVYLSIDEEFGALNLIDSFRALHPDEPGYTQDPRFNILANESPTTRVEPRQRLDYVWAGTATTSGGIYAENSRIVFNGPMDNGFNYSDHFGIQTEFVYVAPNSAQPTN